MLRQKDTGLPKNSVSGLPVDATGEKIPVQKKTGLKHGKKPLKEKKKPKNTTHAGAVAEAADTDDVSGVISD